MSIELAASLAERRYDVRFSIAAGETVALLGANGSGKSTTLGVLAGLVRPDEGRVVIGGTTVLDTAGGTDLPPHRRRVALMTQDPLLFPHLRVRDNVAFGPRSSGRSRSEAARIADHWLEEVGATDLADRRASAVSGGQAQRIALARALAADPELLLLDEPMSSLDVALAPGLRQTLRSALADRTAVVVTHDVLDALLLADRVVVLDEGRVVEDGSTSEVLSRPRSAFAARIAGLNLMAGSWDGVNVVLPGGTLLHGMTAGPAPTAGGDVVATFRPASVAVFREPVAGSPRNSFVATVEELEPLGDVVRVRCGAISADVTLRAAAELGLVPGLQVTLSVKATEVAVYGR
ncbi:molybdate transport system ATP-binding protein [Marmoricola sp. OAE513]|uniref:sulfate/molybdate ABC transporter ATP-binding protein n=1 Tax=Marmoricola sp. OAE513 TaxID=2817894 RepID=UPI001AE58443